MAHFTRDKARAIGSKLGINWEKVDFNQFRKGLEVELEHGKKSKKTDVTHDDPIKTAKIVMAHLNENNKYYNLLSKLESGRLK